MRCGAAAAAAPPVISWGELNWGAELKTLPESGNILTWYKENNLMGATIIGLGS